MRPKIGHGMISKEENILLNAEKLFAEKGFDGTSTREISAAAHVNVSMISYYFGSKEHLLEKIFEYRMRESTEFTKEILGREGINEFEKMMMVITMYIGRVEKLRDFYRVMQTEQFTNKNFQIDEFMKNSKMGFLKVYEQLVNNGFENGIFSKKPKVEFLHATIIGTVFYATNGIGLYREFRKAAVSEEDFRASFFEELQQHLRQIIKDLLGYEKE